MPTEPKVELPFSIREVSPPRPLWGVVPGYNLILDMPDGYPQLAHVKRVVTHAFFGRWIYAETPFKPSPSKEWFELAALKLAPEAITPDNLEKILDNAETFMKISPDSLKMKMAGFVLHLNCTNHIVEFWWGDLKPISEWPETYTEITERLPEMPPLPTISTDDIK